MAKKDTKKTVGIIALAIAGVVAVVGITSALTNDDKTKVLKASDYQVCMLDDTTGKTDKDNEGGISTKSFYKLEELESIEVKKDADVEYYVNVYDEDKVFMQVDKYTADLKDSDLIAYENLGAVYFKVEIVDTEDEKISWFDKFGLVDSVEVTLNEDVEEDEGKEDENTSEAA